MKLRELTAEGDDVFRLVVAVNLREAAAILESIAGPGATVTFVEKGSPASGFTTRSSGGVGSGEASPAQKVAVTEQAPKQKATPVASPKQLPIPGANGTSGHAHAAPVAEEPKAKVMLMAEASGQQTPSKKAKGAAAAAPPAPAPAADDSDDIPEALRTARVMADVLRYLASQGHDTEEKIREACLDLKARAGDQIPVLSRVDADALVDRVRNACAAQGIPPN